MKGLFTDMCLMSRELAMDVETKTSNSEWEAVSTP